MSGSTRNGTRSAGCAYAALAVAAAIPACWHLTFGDADEGALLLAAAWLAGRCSAALQTVARLRVRLADPRRQRPDIGGR